MNCQVLNEGQNAVVNMFFNTNYNIFCTGHAGTGKTAIIRSIIERVEQEELLDRSLAVVAPTNISAYNIGGRTIHSFAGIHTVTDDIVKMTYLSDRFGGSNTWRRTSTLIIDEISMISGKFFQDLNDIAQHARSNSSPFGGVRMIVFGDFLQLPPVDDSIVLRYGKAFQTDAWRNCEFNTVVLHQNMRHTNDQFCRILSKIRLGYTDSDVESYLLSLSRNDSRTIYENWLHLYSLRYDVDRHNRLRLESIDEELITFLSIDTGRVPMQSRCPAQSVVSVKIGSSVMFIRNVNEHIVNGTVGKVVSLDNTGSEILPVVRINTSNDTVLDFVIHRQEWKQYSDKGPIEGIRSQIPLICASARTMHRSQGITVNKLVVSMKDIFQNGQAYVALSRCTDPSNLSIIDYDISSIKADLDCVLFYQSLEDLDVGRSYSLIQHIATGTNSATNVAHDKQTKWAQDTADHMFMKQNRISSEIETESEQLQFK